MRTSRFGLSGPLAKVVCGLLVAAGMTAPVYAEPVPVVTTFSILGDMVEQIGGDRVAVTSLVGPNGDTHVYRPSPADARAVARARVVVLNGLEFEGWMERLLEASDTKALLVTATEGVDAIEYEEEGHHDDHKDGHHDEHKHGDEHARHDDHKHGDEHAKHDDHKHGDEHARHDDHKHGDEHAKHDDHKHGDEHAKHDDHKHGDEHAKHDDHKHGDEHAKHDDHAGHHDHDHGTHDPHAWQDLANAKIYASNIANGLSKVDPANAAFYAGRLADYVKRIDALDAEIKASMAALPADRRTVVTSHDAFQYFGRAYGLTFVAPQGLSTESEASAADVAQLIRQIRAEKIGAVFVENLGDARLVKRIADETGAVVGGTLYPGALSDANGPASTYLDMLRTNAEVLRSALQQ